ncbi:MAG: TspO/MBR family protein [Acidobacteriota bacterium]
MTPRSIPTQLAGLAGWLALTFATAGLGAIASVNAGTFYGGLSRPEWAPPAGVFGPVWSILYLLMGVAAWRIWRVQPIAGRRNALALFLTQLAVNALWSWLFFAWRLGAFAFVDVLVLLALIAATLSAFWRLDRLAGLLLGPYLAWVSFASALTWAVWQRNPNVL